MHFKAQISTQELSSEAHALGLSLPVDLHQAQQALHAKLGAKLIHRLEALDVDRVGLPQGLSVEAAVKAYQASALVASAQPNYIYHALAPNDPYLPDQWYYMKVSADKAFSAGFAFSTTVVAAVIDTGVDSSHEDLASQLVAGHNFVNPLSPPDDDNGHGSMVSGILAAATNNGKGIAGVAFSNVKIMPLKALDSTGSGLDSDIANAIQYAADGGAKVINMSLGSNQSSDVLKTAVDYAYVRGCLLVAASGNDGDTTIDYPAGYPDVVSVGATDHNDARAWYSNYGRVDISAPGGDGYCGSDTCGLGPFTCVPPAQYEVISTCNVGTSSYDTGAGTSFATPMVSAAAALLFAQNPGRTPSGVLGILEQTADPTAFGSGYNSQVGWGRLNVYHALGGVVPNNNSSLYKAYNWPNPFNPTQGSTNITLILPSASDTNLQIFDAAGQLVYNQTLSASALHQGMNVTSWDGRNGHGQLVGNGVYILLITSNGQKTSNRMVVVQ